MQVSSFVEHFVYIIPVGMKMRGSIYIMIQISLYMTFTTVVALIVKLCNILLNGLVCHQQPILVENNHMFLVNLSSLDDPDDINDCGHWVHKGQKSIIVAVQSQNGKVTDVEQHIPPDENSTVYTSVQTYTISVIISKEYSIIFLVS